MKTDSRRRNFAISVTCWSGTVTQSGEVGMRTGNGSRIKDEPRAVGLRFERNRLTVTLDDDREVSVPLSWYPTLQKATPSQRRDWELIGPGKGFFWQSLDLD